MKNSTKIQIQKSNYNFYAYLSAGFFIIANLFLFLLKLWVGLRTNSVAIIADGHTLSDSISSVIILVGIKISEKNAAILLYCDNYKKEFQFKNNF